jgi:hypothetical protein
MARSVENRRNAVALNGFEALTEVASGDAEEGPF